MPLYEHVFLARQDLAQAQVDALVETGTNIIKEGGGRVTKTETWGLRSLAYRMQKNRKAHYVMLEIDAPAPALAELERQTGINEDVIRFMTVRIEKAEAGPSAMMRKQERDRERGDRGPRREGGDRDGRSGQSGQQFKADRGQRGRRQCGWQLADPIDGHVRRRHPDCHDDDRDQGSRDVAIQAR